MYSGREGETWSVVERERDMDTMLERVRYRSKDRRERRERGRGG
jgi:hypothetical protein